MTYSMEEIRSFGIRLHFNTFLGIIFNGLAAYIILKHSTPMMGNYKYYILSTVFFAFLMDFHLSFIFGMFPLFPYHAGCPAGIARYFGPFWGGSFQLGIFHLTLAFCGLSVLFGFVYQYLSITKNNHFLQTFKGGICVGLIMFIYPLPSFILYLLTYSYPQFLEQLKTNDPNLVEFFIAASCDGKIFSKFALAHLGVCISQIFFATTLYAVVFAKIVKRLSAERQQMSKTTLKLQQQYFKTLTIQILLPGVFVVIPVLFLVAMIFLNVGNINAYSQICVQFMSLHSVANSLTIMIVIKSYRQVFIKFSATVFSKACKTEFTYKTSNTLFVQ